MHCVCIFNPNFGRMIFSAEIIFSLVHVVHRSKKNWLKKVMTTIYCYEPSHEASHINKILCVGLCHQFIRVS